eukprot:CAMPEP_0184492798 /NCGR_PEP_ID=MMETSP0113_2-20130426/24302_1 /TAXON_ID=91329 /ORGANISM="Norrisiella sphaerica, Strain BC52" /LENGTH=49 /DNA_ID=CAMNT_0026877793 /DNA_START=258 /DNA_END=407 /DNA_ORIENTATION=+
MRPGLTATNEEGALGKDTAYLLLENLSFNIVSEAYFSRFDPTETPKEDT